MKTFLAKAGEIERKHVLFDAANVPLGRLAVRSRILFAGKDRPTLHTSCRHRLLCSCHKRGKSC
jgi:ribosomal protein L13